MTPRRPFRRDGLCLFAWILACTLPLAAQAETLGDPSLLDHRIQTVRYSPDNVFRLQAFVGRTSVIQFPAGETVNEETGLIVTGDPTAWSLGVNKIGNTMAIKPMTDNDPDTNLVVSTNKRVYLIELKLVKKVSDMTYAMRFVIPELPKPVPTLAALAAPVNPCQGPENRNWQVRGARNLAPTELWDNGTFTCLRFATQGPRPVLYQVMPDGTETLANTRNEQNVLVVHGVSSQYRLRLNDQVLELRTRLTPTPYNFRGTTTGEVRTLKDDPAAASATNRSPL